MTLSLFFSMCLGMCTMLFLFAVRSRDWLMAAAAAVPGVIALDGAIQAYARHL